MKKYLLLLLLIWQITVLHAQTTLNAGIATTPTTTTSLQLRAGTATNRLTILHTSGYVGINNSAPTEILHVTGTTRTSGAFTSDAGVFQIPNANNFSLFMNGSSRVTVASATGNFGIGTSTPTVKLDVVGGGGTGFRVYNATPNPATIEANSNGIRGMLESTSTGGSRSRVGSITSHPLTLMTNNTDRVTILADGKVGIGTATPTANLEVYGSSIPGRVSLEVNNYGSIRGVLESAAGEGLPVGGVRSGSRSNAGYALITNDVNRVFITSDGKVGVGTNTPTEILHIAGGNMLLDNGASPSFYTGTGASELNRYLNITNSPTTATPSGLKAGGLLIADNFSYASPAKNDLVVKGKVAIGTPLTTNPNEYVLAVNGKIGGKDLQLETSSWPDYVFDKTYELPSLKEVEQYIKENNHLKDVPSAESVKANGYSVNEMNEVLLKKVEELTLYAIEQNRKLEEQQKQLDELKKEVKKKKRK